MPRAACTQPDCDKPQVARGLCGTHYKRWQRHGNPDHVTERSDWTKPGPRTLTPTYAGMHSRIRRERGNVTGPCVLCGKPATGWACTGNKTVAAMHGKVRVRYSLNVEDYAPMCTSCNHLLDAAQSRLGYDDTV